MKKILIGLVMAAAAMVAMAEPTFDQVQSMIGQKQYSSAAAGLEVIIQNHPTSAKAFYAMAQAQAGLGDLAKAKRALDKARGLDPELKFASSDNVKSLEQAITPQVAKIEVIEPSHFWRNLFIWFAVLAAAVSGFVFFRNKNKAADEPYAGHVPPKPVPMPPTDSTSDNTYAPLRSTLRPSYPPQKPSYAAPLPASPAPAQPTVINNNYGSGGSGGAGGSDMLAGVLVGNMIANSGSHHSHDTYVEREVIVERPVYRDTTPAYTAPVHEAPSRSSTWDDAPATSTNSSWDDAPAKSSTWDDNSSSGSSGSSWSNDSGSSSSDSSGSSDW